jgi:hypothetical protein
MSATVYREVPGYMGQFVVYEYIKQYVPSRTHHHRTLTTPHTHDRTRPHTHTHNATRNGTWLIEQMVVGWARYLISRQGPECTVDDLHPLHLMLAGGMSGIGAWIASYPMDYVKVRLSP